MNHFRCLRLCSRDQGLIKGRCPISQSKQMYSLQFLPGLVYECFYQNEVCFKYSFREHVESKIEILNPPMFTEFIIHFS